MLPNMNNAGLRPVTRLLQERPKFSARLRGISARLKRAHASSPGGATGSGIVAGKNSALHTLWAGFQSHATGDDMAAIRAYRKVQRMHSPLLRALAGNAEALLVLRRPLDSFFDYTKARKTDANNASNGGMMSLQVFAPGSNVLAPWAGDGEEYSATIESVDSEVGECFVTWADGGDTHRTVPMSGITTLEGTLSACAVQTRPHEVRAWVARRALRQALFAWGAQAECGTTHDAFVDLVGLLCDTATAEVRTALVSPERRWLSESFEHAHRHLQRARWSAERAWAPDPRALAIICMHRAEMLRLGTFAGAQDTGRTARESMARNLEDAHKLHQRVALHLATAAFRGKFQSRASWQWLGGGLKPEVLHELLWAKTLACQVLCKHVSARRRPRPAFRTPMTTLVASRARRPRVRRHRDTSVHHSLPEKLVPSALEEPIKQDALLSELCPARAAMARSWRALCLAAGEPLGTGVSARGILQDMGPERSMQLLSLLVEARGDVATKARLLVEVASLMFAMGCKRGMSAQARAAAAPLAHGAVQQLKGVETADDISAAAALCEAVLGCGTQRSTYIDAAMISKGASRSAMLESAMERLRHADADTERLLRGRWRLVGCHVIEEIWILRHGRQVVHLPGAPALTWCFEGLALSETAPTADGDSPS